MNKTGCNTSSAEYGYQLQQLSWLGARCTLCQATFRRAEVNERLACKKNLPKSEKYQLCDRMSR